MYDKFPLKPWKKLSHSTDGRVETRDVKYFSPGCTAWRKHGQDSNSGTCLSASAAPFRFPSPDLGQRLPGWGPYACSDCPGTCDLSHKAEDKEKNVEANEQVPLTLCSPKLVLELGWDTDQLGDHDRNSTHPHHRLLPAPIGPGQGSFKHPGLTQLSSVGTSKWMVTPPRKKNEGKKGWGTGAPSKAYGSGEGFPTLGTE